MDEAVDARQSVFPLSLNQRNIWALEQSAPGTSINNISATLRFSGRVDFVLLQRAIQCVLRADDSLRTRITLREGEPVQYHAPWEEESVRMLDFSVASEDGFAHWAQGYARVPIFALDAPLYRFVLCRTGERSANLLVETHHIISDGWSQITLCNRVGEAYLALLSGKEPEWTSFPDYADFVAEESRYLAGERYRNDEKYWRHMLEDVGEPVSMKPFRGANLSQVGRRRSYRLSQQLNHAIYSFCREHRVAPFAVFYMALATYLLRSGGGDRFTIGVPVFNRSTLRQKQTTGMFVSTMPFVNQVSGEWSFREFNERLSGSWLEMLRHQRFPFAHMEAMAGGGEPLFRVMLSYQDSQVLTSQDASVSFSGLWYYSGFQMEQLCIHMTNLEDNRVYAVDYDYLTQLFSEHEIDELHQYLCHILTAGLRYPDLPIRELPLLSAQERERVLYRFNQTYALRVGRTPYEMFAAVAESDPRRAAVIRNGRRTTYEQLREEGGRVAAALPREGELVAVLLPRDHRLFSALAGIMQANCAWLILSSEQPARRIEEILRLSGAARLLSIPELAGELDLAGLPVTYVDQLPPAFGEVRRGRPDDLAYVVYTSGSTGAPKGVEIAQRSLVNLAMAMAPVYGERSGAVLSLCGVGFDAFLLESAVAMLCGRTVVLADEREREDPRALAALVGDYGVGFLSTTPSRLTAMLNHPEFALAMGRLDTIVCGGEAFPSELLQRLKGCTDARVFNQYGPSETTVAVSASRLDQAERITIGRPMENCRLYVLDEKMEPLPVRIFGELYVGGTCVGLGYRNDPQLTARHFVPSPFESGEILYKTGDMACWTDDGQLELAGRSDQQVKLRGLRVELQEVSACLCRHPAVSDAAARVLEWNGQTLLVGYYVPSAPVTELELLAFAASYLPHYMLPARLLPLDAIPLTPNGKLDERVLPVPEEEQPSAAPAGGREREILDIFRQVLHSEGLHAESNYFLCGGNSLNAMETLRRMEERFGVRLMVSDLYACRTARGLDQYLSLCGAPQPPQAVPPAPVRESYPLTSTQTAIYLHACLDESGLAYHMPCAFAVEGEVDVPRLERALHDLIADEPLLRTAFVQRDGALAAVTAGQVDFSLEMPEGDSREAVFARFLRPFDLTSPPLLRAALWREAGRWLLLLDVHHLVSDGLSTPILMERLSRLYRGALVAPHLSYLDYAWHRAGQAAQEGEAALAYWREALSGCPAALELPVDHPRPPVFDFKGGVADYTLSPQATQAADRFCARYELTPYMLFAGVLGILFARLAGQDDLVLGAPVSRRTGGELRDVCGPLLATLPLRLRPTGGVEDYFRQVKAGALAMLDHGDCPMEDILAALELPRTTQRNPLYQVMFQMRPLDPGAFALGDVPLAYIPMPTGRTKLDLTVEAAREGSCYRLYLDYAASLFDRETMDYYGRCVEALLRSLPQAEPNAPVAELPLLSPADRLRYFERPRRMVHPYLDLPVHRVVEEETTLHPEQDAVIWHDRRLSFAALDSRARHIAGVLRAHGVERGDRVGLVCRRTPDLLAALLAVLKCGAAYVPFLSDYPAARVAYMMETADARLILCDGESAAALEESARVRPVALLDEEAQPLEESCSPGGEETMYILFTSGSTGKPKGVQLPHRALSNLLQHLREELAGVEGPVLCATNATFDIFITESLLALAQGRCVVLADEEEMLLPWKLADLLSAHRPGVAQFTPSRLQMCLRNDAFAQAAAVLKYTILVGEAVPPALVERFRSCCQGTLMNYYGPTEAAVYVTAGALESGRPVTIGTPLPNCRVYVLDAQGRQLPPTAVGELYLAGVCLADGYVARPELTQQAFVPDPFFPGQRMYRSGDMGRLGLDGALECLGRVDGQVKIDGNRVELGEIADALLQAGADQAVVIPRPNADGSTTLVAAVTPAGVDTDGLRRAVAQVLPPYMLPARLLAMDALPSNASGKTDLPALRALAEGEERPDPQPEMTSAPVSPPETAPLATPGKVTAQALLEIWQGVLGRSPLDPDKPFFEQGGSSLSALNVLGEYFNRGWSMTLAQFYRAPTALAQAALLGGEVQEPAGETPPQPVPQEAAPVAAETPAQTVQAAAPVAAETPAQTLPPRRGDVPALRGWKAPPYDTVLLTGATGFLGAHLLRALLERGCQRVICLLRDGDAARLEETLSWYFGRGWTAGHMGRVEAVKGDVTLTRFGMGQEEYDALAARADALYHAAADVRHYAADNSLLHTNLEGARQAIAFAKAAGAALLHVSTASVSGSHLKSDPMAPYAFTEGELDVGQDWEDNLYIRGKFLAEREIFRAVEEGLPARVFRVGRLIGRREDGVFQKNPDSNAFYRVARGALLLGALPQSLAAAPVELSPVDVCAAAIVALEGAPFTAFHVIQPQPLPLGQALGQAAPGLRILPDGEFETLLARAAAEQGEALASLIDLWNGVKRGGHTITVDARRTQTQLLRAGFRWPEDLGRGLAMFTV